MGLIGRPVLKNLRIIQHRLYRGRLDAAKTVPEGLRKGFICTVHSSRKNSVGLNDNAYATPSLILGCPASRYFRLISDSRHRDYRHTAKLS